jgi:hypothetical protein
MTPKLIDLYVEMAKLTQPLCAGEGAGACRAPHSCCSPEYCEMAMERAVEIGQPLVPTSHPTLPLMGPNGCIAPPHVRPLCTAHVCCINGFGCNPADARWTKRYFALRERICSAEYKEEKVTR